MDACVVIGGLPLDATGANDKTGIISIGYETMTNVTTGGSVCNRSSYH